jgi:hypothetical protein
MLHTNSGTLGELLLAKLEATLTSISILDLRTDKRREHGERYAEEQRAHGGVEGRFSALSSSAPALFMLYGRGIYMTRAQSM